MEPPSPSQVRTRYLIIPSGGIGIRMGTSLPKQYIEVAGAPLIYHTLRAVAPWVDHIIIGANPLYRDLLTSLLDHLSSELNTPLTYTLTDGGVTRFATVHTALEAVPEGALVGIHDAVRPFVSPQTIEQCYSAALQSGGAAPCIALSESIRMISHSDSNSSQAIDRTLYRLVRTPQVFWSERLKAAYQLPYDDSLTDDCSVYERLYPAPVLIADLESNIKLTTPDQLAWANYWLTHGNKMPPL